MKNMMKNIGCVSLGLALAFGLSNTEAAASEDTNTEVQNESKVLSIDIPNVPIVGDVNVSIPSKKSDDEKSDNALVSVEVTDGILDEVNVAVGADTETDEGDTKQALASVEVKSDITNDVNVDVASHEQTEDSSNRGLVEVNAEDLPVVGESHVGVADEHIDSSEGNESSSTSLVQADLDGDLLEDTSVGVVAKEEHTNDEQSSSTSAVANVEVNSGALKGVVDDADVSVLENHESETNDAEQSKKSIASVGLKSPVTNDVNVDVGLSDSKSNETSSSFDAGLVEVNAEDLPLLGETHVGVIDEHTEITEESDSVSAGLVQANLNGDLLEDTSVGVIATETSESAEESHYDSAVVNVSNDGGVLDGLVDELDVTVLENSKSKTNDDEQSKESIVSVGIKSPVTTDVNVDIGLSDSNSNETSTSFDRGLVEVNAEDLPLLGETHVGMLDRHVNSNEEETSFSKGLAQIGLNGDLVKQTAIKILAKDGKITDEGYVVTSGLLQTNLGLLDLDEINIDLLTLQQLYPIAAEDGNDDETNNPGDEDENTTPPIVIDPLPGDNYDGNTVPSTVIVPVPGDDKDDSTTTPGENDSTTNPEDDNEDSNENSNQENDTIVPPVVDNGSNNENGTIQKLSMNNGSSMVAETVMASMNKPSMNQTMGQPVLPKTGGFFDSKRLAFLALLFVVLGLALRRFGKPANYEPEAS